MTKFIIKKSDIIHNYNEVASFTSSIVIPTLKADCYGLGAKKVLEILRDECAVSLFAVSRLEEALELVGSSCDILLLSCYHSLEDIKQIVFNDIICAVDSLGQAKRIGEYAKSIGKTARVHIKIDTGFGRFGFKVGNLAEIKEVYKTEGIKAEGIFSHFSSVFCDSKETDRQYESFISVISHLREKGIDVGLRHIANSSATVRSEKYHLDAVRIGSLLLGRLPMPHHLNLLKVGSFETKIVDIRKLKKGTNIGYGKVYELKKDTKVAVLCTGSADGVLIKKDYDTFRITDILRYGFGVFKMLLKDNSLKIKINGKVAKSVGRVALTHTFADVTDIDCHCGDMAVIDISPLYVADKVEREYI